MQKRNFIVPFFWIVLLCLTAGNFFFWDTVQLASRQASFFYDNNFTSFFLPEDINSGHPPFYGITLALVWSVFGKSLIVSHLFNGLAVLGFIYQAHSLGHFIVGKKLAFLGPLILFCNPIFLGHSILVSPDNILCFLLMWMVNGLLRRKMVHLVFASIFLSILSMRGMMTVAAIFLSEFLYQSFANKKIEIKTVLIYIPAGICALAFVIGHYLHNSWLGFHEDSPWQESFQLVGVQHYIKNLFIIAWRLLDFGNIFLLVPIVVYLLTGRNKIKNFKVYFFLFLGFTIVFVLPLAGFKYLTAHRYFIPIYLLQSFLFLDICMKSKMKKWMLTSCLLLLFLGNWWIYPRTVSQGWDVSLAHLPLYSLVEKMNGRIKEQKIDSKTIGTEFPLKTPSKFLYLDESMPSFKEGIIGIDQFILYSRVINDYKKEDFLKLQREYKLVEDLRYYFIDLQLYEKR